MEILQSQQSQQSSGDLNIRRGSKKRSLAPDYLQENQQKLLMSQSQLTLGSPGINMPKSVIKEDEAIGVQDKVNKDEIEKQRQKKMTQEELQIEEVKKSKEKEEKLHKIFQNQGRFYRHQPEDFFKRINYNDVISNLETQYVRKVTIQGNTTKDNNAQVLQKQNIPEQQNQDEEGLHKLQSDLKEYSFYKVWTTKDEELIRFGEGVYLFWKFLKELTLLFLILSILSLPSIILNILENSLTSIEARISMERTTLANLRENCQETGKCGGLKIVHSIEMSSDLLCSMIFFAYVFYTNMTYKKKLNQAREKFPSPKHFAIEISNFPQDTTEQQLIDHFEQLGGIVECFIIRDYSNIIHPINHIITLEKDILSEKCQSILQDSIQKSESVNFYKRLVSLEQKYDKITRKYGHVRDVKSIENAKLVRANMIFMFRQHRLQLLQEVTDYKNGQKILNKIFRFCSKKVPKPEILNFRNCELKINIAKDPLDINYENIGISKKQKAYRIFITLIIQAGLLFLFFIIMFSVTSFLSIKPSICSSKIDYAQIKTDINFRKITNNVSCYCKKQSISKNLGSDREFCFDYYMRSVGSYVMIVVSGVVIFFTNLIFRHFMNKLAAYCRFETISASISFYNISMFFLMGSNIYLQTYVMKTKVFGFKLSSLVSSALGTVKINISPANFEGFPRSWFLAVGMQLVTAKFIEIFSPHLFVYLYRRVKIKRNIKRASKMNNLKHTFMRILQPYGSDFGWFASRVEVSLFVTMAFSSGIPLLYVLSFLFSLVLFVSMKNFFVKFAKKPPLVDDSLMKFAVYILPLSIFIHLGFGLVMWSDQTLFHKKAQANLIGVSLSTITGDLSQIGLSALVDRLENFTINFIFVLIFTIGYAFLITKQLLSLIFPSSKQYTKEIMQMKKRRYITKTKVPTYLQEEELMKHYTCTSYSMSKIPKYKEILSVFDVPLPEDQRLKVMLNSQWDKNIYDFEKDQDSQRPMKPSDQENAIKQIDSIDQNSKEIPHQAKKLEDANLDQKNNMNSGNLDSPDKRRGLNSKGKALLRGPRSQKYYQKIEMLKGKISQVEQQNQNPIKHQFQIQKLTIQITCN